MAIKQTQGQNWEQLWIIESAEHGFHMHSPLFPFFSGTFLRDCQSSPCWRTMAGHSTARRTLLWLQTFMCLLTDTNQDVFHVAVLTEQLQSTGKYLKSVLIHECPLPFLTLLLLFFGQGEGRTETQQPLLSSQSCYLEYTDFHAMSHHCGFGYNIEVQAPKPPPLLTRQTLFELNIQW